MWEPDGRSEVVNPSDEDGEAASGTDSDGGEVCLFLPGGLGAWGPKVERRVMRETIYLSVLALDEQEEAGGAAGEGREGGGARYRWDADGGYVDMKRVLWINSMPVLNALVVGAVEEVSSG